MSDYRVYEIDSYEVYHYNFEEISERDATCLIMCNKDKKNVGWLKFIREGATIPSSFESVSGTLVLFFPENQLTNMIETLRHEKPLYLWFVYASRSGWLSTSDEPIGEEES